MNNEPKDFWKEKDKLLKFHQSIKLEVARLRLEFEIIKQKLEKEHSDYQELAKIGITKWNFLYKKLNQTSERTEKDQIIQEMNQIKQAVDEINQSRLKLEEIMHTIFK